MCVININNDKVILILMCNNNVCNINNININVYY